MNQRELTRTPALKPRNEEVKKVAMTILNSETPVGQLVADRPARARVFERLGIDYCCGGKMPLDQACRDKGLDVAGVVRELELPGADDAGHDAFDASRATMSELVDHIVASHHGFLQRELPRLAMLADQVKAAHGSNHPELHELLAVLDGLKEELSFHMLKEEKILFPIIKQLETATEMPQFHCGSVINPIAVMEHEHADTGGALARLRSLTGGYAPPADACPTYCALLDGLAELESDLHRHIHEENNILFPRAHAAEQALQGTAAGPG
jgi:regulator of cell morphogenesis and NO signaling